MHTVIRLIGGCEQPPYMAGQQTRRSFRWVFVREYIMAGWLVATPYGIAIPPVVDSIGLLTRPVPLVRTNSICHYLNAIICYHWVLSDIL